MGQTAAVNAMIPKLNMTVAKSNLETLAAFNNRCVAPCSLNPYNA